MQPMAEQSIILGKRCRQRPASRFQRLWAKAATLSADNTQLEAGLDALVRRIDIEVISAELALGKTIRQMVDRQLDFAEKKSLTQWQRRELSLWIDDNVGSLHAMRLIDDTLSDRLARREAVSLGIELDEDSELSAAEQIEKYFEIDAARSAERRFRRHVWRLLT
jgi:hypothetical protein